MLASTDNIRKILGILDLYLYPKTVNRFPSSLQMFNVIKQVIEKDGIERDVYVNKNFSSENIAVLVQEKISLPKSDWQVFCSEPSLPELQQLIEENVDWNRHNQFDVSVEFL